MTDNIRWVCTSCEHELSSEGERAPCPKCGGVTRQTKIGFLATGTALPGVRLKMKRPGKSGQAVRIEQGYVLQQSGVLAHVVRVVDRLRDRYYERVINNKTQEVIHECDHRLSTDHQGHGSAKFSKPKQEPTDSN